jgi:hypothetical protein
MTSEIHSSDRPPTTWSQGSTIRVVPIDSINELLVNLPTLPQLGYVGREFFSTLSPINHSIRYSLWCRLSEEVYAARDSGRSVQADGLACVLVICALGLVGGEGKEVDAKAAAVGFPRSRESREDISKRWLANAMQALLMGWHPVLSTLGRKTAMPAETLAT